MQETLVWFPGWEDTLEMGAATHSSIFAPLVAQLVKNLPALQETWVWALGWKYPLEKGAATHSSILAWRILCDSLSHQESDTIEQLSFSLDGRKCIDKILFEPHNNPMR